MPSEKVEYMIAREGVPYDIFIQRGLLNRSGKNFVDYRDCFNWFKSLVTEYEIYPLKIGYDRYSAQQLVQSMDEFGFHMDDVNQGFNLSSVIRETEGLIKNGDFNIGNNDLMKSHLLNVALKSDSEIGKVKAIKIEERAHIDGCAALLDAMTVRQKYYKEIGGQLKNCS
jgi:phage terminase large subunit-like protein